jgi:hypothetical protein
LALTSPTFGGRSVSIVLLRTKTTEFFNFYDPVYSNEKPFFFGIHSHDWKMSLNNLISDWHPVAYG